MDINYHLPITTRGIGQELDVAFALQAEINDLLSEVESNFRIQGTQDFLIKSRSERSDEAAVQKVYQYQKKRRKCKNVKSVGVTSGSNAVSYMSFIGAVITLVLNINNNINANNNNNNRFKVNFGKNSNTLTNLNQNVGNNFNLMFPPGRKKRSFPEKSFPDGIKI